MTTYSLNAGLFVFDRDFRAVGDPVKALEAVAFRETELMAEGDEWQTPGEHDPAKLRAAVDHLGIFPHTIHAPFQNVNLASPDPELRRVGVAVVADTIRFLGELGGRTAVVHPSARPGPGGARLRAGQPLARRWRTHTGPWASWSGWRKRPAYASRWRT